MRHRSFLSSILIFTALGCGSSVNPGEGGGGSGGATSTSTSTGTGAGGGLTSCPTVEPVASASCGVEELRCSYGESVVPECRRGWRCQQGTWQPDGNGCEDEPAACGAQEPPAGMECPDQEALCVAGKSFCVCAPCGGAGCPPPPWSWSCAGAPSQVGCPEVIPNDGTSCADEGLSCHYGISCAAEASINCTKGAWLWSSPMPCP